MRLLQRTEQLRRPIYRRQRKSKKRLAVIFGVLFVLMMLAQLGYPSTRTRPLIKIDGRSFGFASAENIETRLQKLDDQSQKLKLDKTSYQTSAKQIGIVTDVSKVQQKALDYSLWQRLVPFSLFSFGQTNKTPDRIIDEQTLNLYIEKLIIENTQPAKNPQIFRTESGDFNVRPGENGSTYEAEKLKNALIKLPYSDDKELTLAATKELVPSVTDQQAEETAPKIKANEQALNKLIADWRAEYPNAKTAVYFQEINGFGRVAKASEKTSFFAASLYKFFVAHYVMNGIDKKTISPTQSATGGRSIESCLRVMIVNSDNPCPEAMANRFGWSTINQFAASNGFEDSNVEYGDNTVTATDMANFLVSLNAGELLSQEQTDKLLSYMRVQVYRSAIPAGLPGVTVEDKVGFYIATWHDAAIVRSKKTTYALVVLTEGTGSGAIAELAKKIDELLIETF